MFLRKLMVGCLSAGFLCAAYLGYSHFAKTPPIEIQRFDDRERLSFDDANSGGAGGRIGELSDILLNSVVYRHRDENDRVDRELGFAKLWHRGRSIWKASGPFMTLYPASRELTCRITADEGTFRIENSRNPYPTDVTFTGNVRVRVLPEPNSPWEEVNVFMDDIVFLNDKTQFSTLGEIHVVSDRVDLVGQGMRFVYDPIQDHIQYFQLYELEHLHLKAPRDLFARDTELQRSIAQIVSPADETSVSAAASPSATLVPYECVLYDNVRIHSPKQHVRSHDHITLTDIFWRGSSQGRPNPPAAGAEDAGQSDPPIRRVSLPDVNDAAVIDIAMTCDGGLLLAPRDANWAELDRTSRETAVPLEALTLAPEAGQAIFEAGEIGYSLLSRDGFAGGPVELSFYAPEPNDLEATGRLIPIKVNARKGGTYLSQENSILFEGECICRLLREGPNAVEQYSLSAPKLRIDLLEDKEGQAIAANIDLKHLEASGGDVELGIYSRVRTDMTRQDIDARDIETLLAGVELRCQRLECDPNEDNEVFIATGPGTIRLNNSKSQGFGQRAESQRPCYAMMEGFETLRFYVADDRIVADGNSNSMVFHYFPVVDGNTDQHILAQANHIEIQLVTTATGEREMGNLVAAGNVYFENADNDRHRHFRASGLSYDHEKQTLVMWSDLQTPCQVDGKDVVGIQYNIKTGELRTEFIGPVNFSLY